MILQPPAVLVVGPPGSGKSDSLATLIEAGLETFLLSTEPDGVASVLDSIERRRKANPAINVDKLHWHQCLPASGGVSALESMVSEISSKGYDDLTKIKNGVAKDRTREAAMNLLEQLRDFECERTGLSYGPFVSWDDSAALVIDSLSGINAIAWLLTIGYKPAAHQGEWGVAMNFVEQLLNSIQSDRHCMFVLTAHAEKEINELTGVSQIMASTLGRKLAPKIPRYFSEVVLARKNYNIVKNEATYVWSTADSTADLKNRSLPIGNDLVQSFVPVVSAYRTRKRLASVQPVAGAQSAAPATTPAKTVVPPAPLRPATQSS